MMTIQAKLIALLGAAIVLLLIGFALESWGEHRGAQLERSGWQEKERQERIADAALIAQHAAEMQALTDHQRTIERQTSENHQQELLDLRHERDRDRAAADRAGGLRIVAPACPPGGAVARTEAAGAERRDESPGPATVRLPQPVEDDLWAAADAADEVSAQLRACQGWVRANGFYGTATAENSHLLDRMIAGKNKEPEAEQ